jgi:hypothetical protein
MAHVIKLKRSNVAGSSPTDSQLEVGEIAINMADSLLFFKEPGGEIKEVTVSNVLKLDQTEEYVPSANYHPATKAYVDLKVIKSLVNLITIPKTLISNNEIILPKPALSGIVYNYAMIYNEIDAPYFIEVTCELSPDNQRVLFDPLDSLNGKYAVVTYLTFINNQ